MADWYLHNNEPYTGDRIAPDDLEITARPSPDHVWSGAEWQLQPRQDWNGLMNSLRGSAVYARLYTAANQPDSNTVAALTKTVQANTALTLLQDAMTFQNLDDLQFAIAQLRFILASTAAGDFTAEELTWINTQLSANGFQLQLS